MCLFNSYTPLAVNSRWPREPYLDPVVLAGLPLDKLAYFRPPWQAMWSPNAAGSFANTVTAFVAEPDMGWVYPARIAQERDGDASAAQDQSSENGAVMQQLRSIETMVSQGVLSEERGRKARARVLGVGLGSGKL